MLLLAFVVTVLVSVRIFLANSFIEDSKEVAILQKHITKQKKDNKEIVNRIREKTSLVVLETRATEMGFRKTQTYTYIYETPEFAMSPFSR